MNKQERIEQLLINHSVQLDKHDDISGIGRIRRATKREIIKAYRRVGRPLPEELQPKLKLLNKKTA